MSKVICDKRKTCEEAPLCGGAKPHERCEECGICPFDQTQECVELEVDE